MGSAGFLQRIVACDKKLVAGWHKYHEQGQAAEQGQSSGTLHRMETSFLRKSPTRAAGTRAAGLAPSPWFPSCAPELAAPTELRGSETEWNTVGGAGGNGSRGGCNSLRQETSAEQPAPAAGPGPGPGAGRGWRCRRGAVPPAEGAVAPPGLARLRAPRRAAGAGRGLPGSRGKLWHRSL